MREIENGYKGRQLKKVLTVRRLLVGVTSEAPHSSSAADKTYLKMERITRHILWMKSVKEIFDSSMLAISNNVRFDC